MKKYILELNCTLQPISKVKALLLSDIEYQNSFLYYLMNYINPFSSINTSESLQRKKLYVYTTHSFHPR